MFLQHLAPLLLNLVASNEWKLRVALAYNLAPLVRWLGIDEFMAQYKTVVETLSHDVVFQVRQLALEAWIVIFELQAEQTWRQHAFAFIDFAICFAGCTPCVPDSARETLAPPPRRRTP